MTKASCLEELDLEALAHWFGYILNDYYTGSELIDLLMVATGNRENCLVAIYSKDYERDLIEFCEYFGLNYRVENTKDFFGRIKDLFRKIRGEKIYMEAQIWISHNEIPRFTSNWSQKDIGGFLNYPESAIEAFLDDDKISEKTSDYVSFRPAKNDIDPLLEEEDKRIKFLQELEEKGLDFPSRWLNEFEPYSNASS